MQARTHTHTHARTHTTLIIIIEHNTILADDHLNDMINGVCTCVTYTIILPPPPQPHKEQAIYIVPHIV